MDDRSDPKQRAELDFGLGMLLALYSLSNRSFVTLLFYPIRNYLDLLVFSVLERWHMKGFALGTQLLCRGGAIPTSKVAIHWRTLPGSLLKVFSGLLDIAVEDL